VASARCADKRRLCFVLTGFHNFVLKTGISGDHTFLFAVLLQKLNPCRIAGRCYSDDNCAKKDFKSHVVCWKLDVLGVSEKMCGAPVKK
jgi:hypothetical protein